MGQNTQDVEHLQAEIERLKQRIADLEARDCEQSLKALEAELHHRKNIETALRQSEARYRAIIDDPIEQVARFYPDGTLTFVNEAHARYFAMVPDDLIGKNFLDFLPPDERQRMEEHIAHLSHNHPIATVENWVTRPDGRAACIQWTSCALFNDDSDTVEIQSVGRDITPQKQAEYDLHKSEQKFRHFFQQSLDGLVLVNSNGVIVDWNKGAEQIWGLKYEDVAGQYIWDIQYRLAPTERKTLEGFEHTKAMAQRLLEGEPLPFVGQWIGQEIQRPDGTRRTTHSMVFPIQTDSEILLGSIVRDITALKQVEQDLRESEERHRIISELISDYVYASHITTDKQIVTEWVSGAFERITGYTLDEIRVPDAWCSLIHPDDAHLLNDMAPSLQAGRTCVIEYRIITKQGTTRWLRDYIRPVYDEAQQQVVQILGAVQNITERKQGEEALRAARDEAEAANRAKNMFLANMSHEIRTPLNAIIGMTNLLLDANITPEEYEFVEIARSSGNALLVIMNDILDFARMETGTFQLEYLPFHLHECVQNALDSIATQAHDKGLRLTSTIDASIPTILAGDGTRLYQILVNLLNNAVKFTPHGEIVVSVEMTTGQRHEHSSSAPQPPDDDTSHCAPPGITLHLSVSDTGIGISQEHMQHLFQPFFQLDGSMTRSYGGIGMGLVISKRLAEMMGGTIWAESEKGKGSTFHVVVCMDRVADAPAISEGQKATDTLQSTRQDTHPHKPHYTPMLPLRLLLAEDNTSSQRVVLRLLEHLDYRADVAASGTEVMEAMERQQYDVILMDAHMPEMDGPETARAIRATIPPNQQPWIIAMVAPTMPRSPDWLRISGMNDELRKPVRLEELKQALIRAPRLSSRISRIADVTLDSATVERFLSTVGHENPVVMRNLVDTFLNDTCEKITMMHQALEQQRLDHLARLARSIISNSRQIGALALATLCRDIEATAEGNMNDQMYEHAREHIRRAREEYARVREALVQQVLVFSRYHAVANR